MAAIRLSGGYQAEHFVPDGALRDVSVPDAGLAVWERLLAGLTHAPGEYQLSVNGEGRSAEDFSVAAFFAAIDDGDDDGDGDDDDGDDVPQARLAVGVDGMWFVSFFFEVDEIEFTFDPEGVTDSAEFGRLERFMLWLAEVCGRKVVMTMESSTGHRDAHALLETLP